MILVIMIASFYVETITSLKFPDSCSTVDETRNKISTG
jgi:hypothetical protein